MPTKASLSWSITSISEDGLQKVAAGPPNPSSRGVLTEEVVVKPIGHQKQTQTHSAVAPILTANPMKKSS